MSPGANASVPASSCLLFVTSQAAAPSRMEINDLEFLRQDNTNLLKEVNSLRSQSTLLRNRSDELERKLRDFLAGGTTDQAYWARCAFRARRERRHGPGCHGCCIDVYSQQLNNKRHEIPDVKEGLTDARSRPKDRVSLGSNPDAAAVWFDDTPIGENPRKPILDRLTHINLEATPDGSQLIGEAPRATPDLQPRNNLEKPYLNQPSTFSPPSPDPSEGPSRVAVPSLLSVVAPVSGVALPDVPLSLLRLKLIPQETYDSPAAVASFLQKVTEVTQTPQKTYRAAFTAAFLTLIPLLGPPGTISTQWLSFLHDFPSRILHTQRDSFVSIPWPESCISGHGANITHYYDQQPVQSPNYRDHRRRSRSLDGLTHEQSLLGTQMHVTGRHAQHHSTGVPPCERDAWVLLLALTYAAFPSTRIAAKLRKLPVAVKLQMVAWLPPGV
ncbi:hypothetical protein K439DRAFT_1612481 [Ramaria rubella]|nr:hypothetical protein K439DRAFT_1612481 [Ramaria rubella]